MQIGLICGESAGLLSIKKILNIKKVKIIFIVSANEKYDYIIKNICTQNKIIFFKKKQFKKKIIEFKYYCPEKLSKNAKKNVYQFASGYTSFL